MINMEPFGVIIKAIIIVLDCRFIVRIGLWRFKNA